MNKQEIDKLLPKNKFDSSNLDKIEELNNEDFSLILKDFLMWTQDANFPIFKEVTSVLVKRQDIIIDEMITILKGNDEEWKYFISEYIVPQLSENNRKRLEKWRV